MMLAIRHETIYRYTAPMSYTIQQLRLTPRSEPRPGLAMQVCAVARAMSRDLGATRWPITPEGDARPP